MHALKERLQFIYDLYIRAVSCRSIGNDMIPMDGLKKIIALLGVHSLVNCIPRSINISKTHMRVHNEDGEG